MERRVYALPQGAELIFDGPMLSVRFGGEGEPMPMVVNDGSHGLMVLAKIIEEEALRMRAEEHRRARP